MGRNPLVIAPDLPTFEALLPHIPWFRNLGQPHPRDSQVARIHDFAEWRGPELGYGCWFGRYPAVVRERIVEDFADRRDELNAVWDRIEQAVIEIAQPTVPGCGDGDAWHGPTACVYQGGYTAALVGWHLLLNRPLPDPIAEQWAWLVAGYWPCDYAEQPPGYWDESLVEVPAGKLVVF